MEENKLTPREELKTYFKTGEYPTQNQFSDLIDSYWHKDEVMDLKAINGLQDSLDNKLDKEVEKTLLKAVNDAVASTKSIVKGEAFPNSSPTIWMPGEPDLYEKWEARTVGTYINFKNISGVPIEVTTADLDEQLVFLNVSNGVTKKDFVAVPGVNVALEFDSDNNIDAQGGKQINSWLVNKVKGGESDEVRKSVEEVGGFYKNIGVELAGTSPDGIQAGLYNIKSNTTAVSDSNKFLTKANIRLAVAGNLKFCIGRYDGTKFIMRWESEEKSGVAGWNNFDFTSQKIKINTGEMAAVVCLPTTSAQIFYGDPGAAGNRFVQYSTTSGGVQAGVGSYYALWFELSDINETTLQSESVFNLSKSVSKIVEDYSQNGYTGVEVGKGESGVSADSDGIEGYAINKLELENSHILEKIEIRTVTAGDYQIVTGFLDQAGKFIETNVIRKTLNAGLNVVTIDPVILAKGEYVGLKFPSKFPVNNTPAIANLWAADNYTGVLTQVSGKSLPMKLYLKEYIESPISTKSDLSSINSSIAGLQQNFTFNGKKVSLLFNPDGSVTWDYVAGYSNILHLGNSIARHPVLSYWWGSWGMAASEKSKDYVHRFLEKMKVFKPAATTDVLNIAGWETSPSTWDKSQLDTYLSGKDLICVRLGENAVFSGTFKSEYSALINYIKIKNPTAKIIIGGVFWADVNKDSAMSQVATENNLTFVKISHLDIPANRSYMGAQVKADDGQWHTVNNSGVAIHPGDLGMEAIASEMFNALGL